MLAVFALLGCDAGEPVAPGSSTPGVALVSTRRASTPEQAFPGETGPVVEIDVNLGVRRARVTGMLVRDQLVIGGDALLPLTGLASGAPSGADPAAPPSAGVVYQGRHWDGGVVPYVIDEALDAGVRAEVEAAIAHWNGYTARTGVTLREATGSDAGWVRFAPPNCSGSADAESCPITTCSASLGRSLDGGEQAVSVGTACASGNIAHEIGHAVGLFHEQSRMDRDDWIEVRWDRIDPSKVWQFLTYADQYSDGADLGSYDLDSIMQYPSDAYVVDASGCWSWWRFSETTTCSIVSDADGDGVWDDWVTGQRSGLSEGDLDGVARLYASTWQVSWGAASPWQTYTTSTVALADLRVVDADDPTSATDPVDDVVWIRSGQLVVRYGETAVERSVGPVRGTISSLAFADVDGNGLDDVVRARGTSWEVSPGIGGAWTALGTSAGTPGSYTWARVDSRAGAEAVRSFAGAWQRWDVTLGRWQAFDTSGRSLADVLWLDVDGDGLDEALVATDAAWELRDGATGAWSTVDIYGGPRATLLAADLDADGDEEVVIADGTSRRGWDLRSRFEWDLGSDPTPASDLVAGDLDGDGADDLLATMGPLAEESTLEAEVSPPDAWWRWQEVRVRWTPNDGGTIPDDVEVTVMLGTEVLARATGMPATGELVFVPDHTWPDTNVDPDDPSDDSYLVGVRLPDGSVGRMLEGFSLDDPSVTITAPGPAEHLSIGYPYTLAWTLSGSDTFTLTVETWGGTYYEVVETLADDAPTDSFDEVAPGSFTLEWTPTGDLYPTGTYIVCLYAWFASDCSDTFVLSEDCDDGLDGDADGWADADDPDCVDTAHELYPSGLAFTRLPPGTFTMGSPSGEVGRDADETEHTVELTRAFWMGTHEVTRGQFREVLGYWRSYSDGGDDSWPAGNVNWNEAAAFANAVSALEGLPACYTCSGSGASVSCDPNHAPYDCTGYRLPTEAEWEYAARAGTTSAFHNGGNLVSGDEARCSDVILDNGARLDDIATLCGYGAVGAHEPNAWGLYDMHGNAWEFVNDWYAAYSTTTATDPVGPSTTPYPSPYRILRGGSSGGYPLNLRSAARVYTNTGLYSSVYGFRLARTSE